MRNVLKDIFSRGTSEPTPVKLDRGSGQHGLAKVPSLERRTLFSMVQHKVNRLVQNVAAASSRATKAERAAQLKEKAALNSVDQELGNVIKLVSSGRPAVVACEKVAHALNSISPKTTAPSNSAAQLLGSHVLQQLAALTVAELATLKDVLVQCQQSSSDPEIQKLNRRVQSDPVMQQLDISVKSEVLRHKLVQLNLENEARWALRPLDLWAKDKVKLVGLKEVRDLARSLIEKVDKNASDDTVLAGTHCKLGDLKELRKYGDSAAAVLAERAIKSVGKASPEALKAMTGPELKALKEEVDFLLENPVKGMDTVHLQGLKSDALSAITAYGIKTTENLLGKGPFNAQLQDTAKLAALADDIARLEDRPRALDDALQAITVDIDRRKREAKADYQNALQEAVRNARGPHGAQALMGFAAKAQAAEGIFRALKPPLQMAETTRWIEQVLRHERGPEEIREIREVGELSLKTVQNSLNAGAGKRLWSHLAAQNDGSVGPLIQLSNALNTMFPKAKAGSSPAKEA